ncbi:MAG TPA: hypothetical protein VHB25_08450 [Gemmatimonadaceae bacterium]|nr:hypothetical protein [Gemmatimonadaceae bacterium]
MVRHHERHHGTAACVSRGRENDESCQLCFAEAAKPELMIAGIRLGERCHARAMAIAGDAALERDHLEQFVYRESLGAVVCTTCGAELEVDEQQLALRCPNGHAVELRTTRPDPAKRAHVCDRCHKPIERTPGQIGRTPRVHAECQTEADRKCLAYTRQQNAARAKANPDWWKKYQPTKAGAR